MRVIIAGIAIWFLTSAFFVFVNGLTLWVLKKFSALRELDGAGWARLTALGLLLPPSLGIAFAIAGLTSATLCPAITARNYHLCMHLARHLCGHATAANVLKSRIVLWGTLAWCGLAGATLVLSSRRRRYIKRIEPSPKLRQAISQANLPKDLPVWETDGEIAAGLVGVVSPSIFISQDLVRRLPVRALTVILSHEYAHFSRRDHLCRLLLFATALIFAPIPFAVWLQREWRDASEKAADDFAASSEKSTSLLALTLKVVQSGWEIKSDEQLNRRVERLRRKQAGSFPKVYLSVGAVIFGLAFCLLVFHLPPLWLTLHCFAEALMLK